MDDLYALAMFSKKDGSFYGYVRKGRNNSISGYDTLSGARRGYAHSKNTFIAEEYDLKIVKAVEVNVVKEVE